MKVKLLDKDKIEELSNILKSNRSLEFQNKDLYCQIFESTEIGYVINIYSSNEKDEDGDYLNVHMVDGGIRTGNAKNAVEFLS